MVDIDKNSQIPEINHAASCILSSVVEEQTVGHRWAAVVVGYPTSIAFRVGGQVTGECAIGHGGTTAVVSHPAAPIGRVAAERAKLGHGGWHYSRGWEF